MHLPTTSLLVSVGLAASFGCSSNVSGSGSGSEGDGGSGGNTASSGGADATGGGVASGGADATGGTDATGGAEATGGANPGSDCVDMDGDTFGVDCDPGPDSCDDDPNNWTQFGCDNCESDDGSHIDCDENGDAFITQWMCDEAEGEKTVVLPLKGYGAYNFTVDWGDGSPQAAIRSWDSPEREHTYATDGPHAIRIEGEIAGWDMWHNDSGTCDLIELTKWGPFAFGEDNDGSDPSSSFYGSHRLKIVATDIPDLSRTRSLLAAFRGCSSIDRIPSIEDWDVSRIRNMAGMFASDTTEGSGNSFNEDISGWDVSSVERMGAMFLNAKKFNQDLSNWDVSNVWDTSWMFLGAESFDQDISGWDVSNVDIMGSMFQEAKAFNADISGWNTSNVIQIHGMFFLAESFNQDLSGWDVSNVSAWSNAVSWSGMSESNKQKLRDAGWPDDALLNR